MVGGEIVPESGEIFAHSRSGTAQLGIATPGYSVLAPDTCLFSSAYGPVVGASALEIFGDGHSRI